MRNPMALGAAGGDRSRLRRNGLGRRARAARCGIRGRARRRGRPRMASARDGVHQRMVCRERRARWRRRVLLRVAAEHSERAVAEDDRRDDVVVARCHRCARAAGSRRHATAQAARFGDPARPRSARNRHRRGFCRRRERACRDRARHRSGDGALPSRARSTPARECRARRRSHRRLHRGGETSRTIHDRAPDRRRRARRPRRRRAGQRGDRRARVGRVARTGRAGRAHRARGPARRSRPGRNRLSLSRSRRRFAATCGASAGCALAPGHAGRCAAGTASTFAPDAGLRAKPSSRARRCRATPS